MSDKSLFLQLAETYERHRLTRRAADGTEPKPRPLGRFLRWMVPNGGTILLVLVLILTQQVWARPAQQQVNAPGPSATTVNYQGRLADPLGNPLDGTYGMAFALYAAPSGGAPVWGPENHPAVPVSGGLFSVGLGSQTSGGIPTTTWDGDRYLEITVGGETLAPRELIRSVPIAGLALTVPDGAITTAKLADGAVTSSKMAPSWYETFNTTVDSTTSTTPVPTGESLTFTCESDCTALILHRGSVAHSAQDGRTDVIVLVDGVLAFSEHGVNNVGWPADSAWHGVSGFDFVNLSAGAHTVEVQFYCRPSPAGTCKYWGGGTEDWEHLYVLVFAQP